MQALTVARNTGTSLPWTNGLIVRADRAPIAQSRTRRGVKARSEVEHPSAKTEGQGNTGGDVAGQLPTIKGSEKLRCIARIPSIFSTPIFADP
jgi:hypothetical protein